MNRWSAVASGLLPGGTIRSHTCRVGRPVYAVSRDEIAGRHSVAFHTGGEMVCMNILTVDSTEIQGATSGIESVRRDGRADGQMDAGEVVRQVEPICGESLFRSVPEYSQVVA